MSHMLDPLHEVACKIYAELKADKVTLSSEGWALITVGKPTSEVDVVGVLKQNGFHVTDCDPSERDPLLFKDCFGAFSGYIQGKRVLGLIYYDDDKRKVNEIKIFYQPGGGQA